MLNYIKELDGLNTHLPSRRVQTERWTSPTEPTVKIDFDVVFSKQKKESCSGMVVQNEKAETLCLKIVIHENIPSAFTTDAMACLQAIHLRLTLVLMEVEMKEMLER